MAEQIRALAQARPLPGAVHRLCVGRWRYTEIIKVYYTEIIKVMDYCTSIYEKTSNNVPGGYAIAKEEL